MEICVHVLGWLGRVDVHRTGRKVLEFSLTPIEKASGGGLNEPIPLYHDTCGL